ncbi:DNA mismatch repair protein Msh6 [Neolentinus lepideus HHB14362 ss-1]|uniref:DNA mismatch repair protein n=1 Tax=Neolentinus lepideus HHB14362 ss-1 TaxID=1314782 RepID=A0A165RCW1_9AGAM|nr:DNA mismatch repair protein Msh6 [Neolentinus lepideus HHB14362 ss-1]
MPPQKSVGQMKQKSLMSWFGKPNGEGVANGAVKTPKKEARIPATPVKGVAPVEKPVSLRTPEQKQPAPSSQPSATTRSSDGEGWCSSKDTPPTSDLIDVDMLSGDEAKASKSKSTKRKMVIDSDEEETFHGAGKGSSIYRSSSPVAMASKSQAKKPRVSLVPSDDEDDDNATISSFSSRLTRFRKSPTKRLGSRSDGDDDDFVVPEEEDESDAPSARVHGRGRSSSTSSRSTALSDGDFDDDGSEEETSKAKKTKSRAKVARPALKSSNETGRRSSDAFLTAAEQRMQAQKNEKKSTEEPFAFLVNPRDKDGLRPGEPGYDPRTLFIPRSAWKEFSPFEKQFWEIKQNHFDTVLFFQKGKFFELYEEDARVGHREFDLKMTQRVKMSMVGVPEMSFNFWAAKFLAKGYKVGRVDQAETALGAEMRLSKSKGKAVDDKPKDKIVRRQLNKVYTNGTLVDDQLLSDDQAGHCISIREEPVASDNSSGSFGICVLDSSTSEFSLSSFEDDVCRTKLETMMRQLRPKELVYTKGNLSVPTTRLLKGILPPSCLWTSLRDCEGFSYDATLKELKNMYPPGDDEDAMMEDDALGSGVPEAIRTMIPSQNAVVALGAMIWYLRQLNIDKDIFSMKNFNVYDPMKRGQGLILDGQTLAHIEVLMNSENTEEGTLLKLFNHCITPFGKRLFRIWLCVPLREVSDINARLDAVQDLLDHPTFENEFTDIAKGLPDLERIVSRIHARNCKVLDFLKVLNAFDKLNKGLVQMAKASETFKSNTILGLLRSAPDVKPNIKHAEQMFIRPEKGSDELVPKEGKDEAYDNIMAEISGLEEELDQELKKLEKKTGLSLSYWHSAVGTKDIYLVQTSANEKDIPKNWTKSGATKAYKRWLVPSLVPTIRKVKEARENRSTIVKDFKNRVFAEFDTDRAIWLRAIRVMAELDCLFSLAKASSALGEPVCRPEFIEGDSAWVQFEQLRHPALCARNNNFIPNDIELGGSVGRIALLTGPNMGGKSTVMRMTAVGVIMAQLGMLVPAAKARICPVDAILTRMGAYDNMFANASTFKVELDECSKILRDATPKSLVILDELGRGTSTYDGMAIASAVLHHLATHILALSFFATHYGSLTDDFSYHPNIRNMHMETLVDDDKRELVFLYKLVEGVATSSFGTHVANLAGVPMEVIKRAAVVSDDFAKQFKDKVEGRKKQARLPLVAQADFVHLYGLALGNLKLDDDPVRKREVMRLIKGAVGKYITQP